MVIGNDISLPRLKITKNILSKYNPSSNTFLLNQDARELPQAFYKNAFKPTELQHIYKYKTDQNCQEERVKITKILVDVECSHDGSLKHMLKYFKPSKGKKFGKKDNKNQPLFVISNKEKKRRARQAEQNRQYGKSRCYRVL